jgi:toxin secretion/phage lysis holin
MGKLSTFFPDISGITALFGIIGAGLAAAFGGWDAGMRTLVLFMGVDYISGLVVAGVFKRSGKSESGALESRAGFKGLCRKGMVLLMVLVASELDRVLGINFTRDAVIMAYVANETISIVENAGLMGIPIPSGIRKAIDILGKKAEPEKEQA